MPFNSVSGYQMGPSAAISPFVQQLMQRYSAGASQQPWAAMQHPQHPQQPQQPWDPMQHLHQLFAQRPSPFAQAMTISHPMPASGAGISTPSSAQDKAQRLLQEYGITSPAFSAQPTAPSGPSAAQLAAQMQAQQPQMQAAAQLAAQMQAQQAPPLGMPMPGMQVSAGPPPPIPLAVAPSGTVIGAQEYHGYK